MHLHIQDRVEILQCWMTWKTNQSYIYTIQYTASPYVTGLSYQLVQYLYSYKCVSSVDSWQITSQTASHIVGTISYRNTCVIMCWQDAWTERNKSDRFMIFSNWMILLNNMRNKYNCICNLCLIIMVFWPGWLRKSIEKISLQIKRSPKQNLKHASKPQLGKITTFRQDIL